MRKLNKRQRKELRNAFVVQKVQQRVQNQQTAPMEMARKIMDRSSSTWTTTWNEVSVFDSVLERLQALLMNPMPGQEGLTLVVLEMKKQYEQARQAILGTVESGFATATEACKITSFQPEIR